MEIKLWEDVVGIDGQDGGWKVEEILILLIRSQFCDSIYQCRIIVCLSVGYI